MSDLKYSVVIKWSEEDQAFVAKVPELSGCMADGLTQIEALENLKVVINDWIETSRSLPDPVYLLEEDFK